MVTFDLAISFRHHKKKKNQGTVKEEMGTTLKTETTWAFLPAEKLNSKSFKKIHILSS